MLRKLSSIKKRYFVIPIAVVSVIAAAAIIWSLRQKDTLDFSDFTREEEQYCYQNIPWGIDPETAEKQLKRTLEQLPSTPTYYDAGIINAGGYKGSFRAEFEEGKRLITVEISFPREMDDTSVDYSEIESEALEAFKKQYGEETRKNDSMGIDGLYHRNTSWYSRNEDGQVTILTVQASHNTQRVVDLMVVTGVVPPEIWERVQKEGNLNNAAEQEESTDMPNHKNVENPSEQIKPSSTPQEQTSTSETQGKIAISLKELKDGEGFGFGDTWNLSLEETEEKLGMELEPLSEVGNVKNYRISDDVYLVEAERCNDGAAIYR